MVLANQISRRILLVNDNQGLEELNSIFQRIGLGDKVEVKRAVMQVIYHGQNERENQESLYTVSLDGVDIGFLSDGTLRILSLILGLIEASTSSTTIIEEPEMHIQPGMLSKLINEIKAYTYGSNLIISTHSPQVVAHVRPDQINLVHRENGRTYVRKLSEEEVSKISDYLYEEGNLGEWIYSGMIDD